MKPNLLIIGGGLSGLYAAYKLQNQYNITLLEARNRLGGRILTLDGNDMGPSWIWSHQKNILSLIAELDLELFNQYTTGLAVYQAHETQRFNPPPQAPSARVKGGLEQLIKALYSKLHTVTIHYSCCVHTLTEHNNQIIVTTNKGDFIASKVLSTLPPRVASHIHYEPQLPQDGITTLQSIPTWMGQSTKVVVQYETPFWRDEGLSGFAISHKGPLGEIHDACTPTQSALFGFVSNSYTEKTLKEDVIAQLVQLFGQKAHHPIKIYTKSWKKDSFTASKLDKTPLSSHPNYGYTLSHFNKKLIFIGTESAFEEGGYLEGALTSVLQVIPLL